MSQENFNQREPKMTTLEKANDNWSEYEIPITDYDLNSYFDRLWLPESNYGFNGNSLIETLANRPGYILDIGAGKSNAIIELNKALVRKGAEPKAIRLDLSYGNPDNSGIGGVTEIINSLGLKKITEVINSLKGQGTEDKVIEDLLKKENKNLTAVCADAFNLPFKKEKFQLVVSNELIPYFLEDRDGDEYKKFLLRRQLSWQLCKLKEKGIDQLTKQETEEFEKVSAEMRALPFSLDVIYDLKLFEKFFKEISRVLKNTFQPSAEARIYPFVPRMLFNQKIEVSYSQQRIENFISLMEENFKSIRFYPNIDIDPTRIRLMREAGFFDSMEKCYKSLPENATANLRKIIANPDDLAYPGLLVLRK